MDYLSHPDESLDKNYSPLRQKYRKELRRMDEETKKDGGVVDWNYISVSYTHLTLPTTPYV